MHIQRRSPALVVKERKSKLFLYWSWWKCHILTGRYWGAYWWLLARVINTTWHNRQTPKFQRLNPTEITPCLHKVWCGSGSPPPHYSYARGTPGLLASSDRGERRMDAAYHLLWGLHDASSVFSKLVAILCGEPTVLPRLSFYLFSFWNFLWLLCSIPSPVLGRSIQFLILTGLCALWGQKLHHI